ncbi:MAG TPA: Rieske (2Fe-2S) protein [Gemmatimonadales bacterium]|nr:Rieske (2Fe-2S) protein [Gemmatimonadales bacterium]
MHGTAFDSARRKFFARTVKAIQTSMAAVVGLITGGAILSPGFARRAGRWLPVSASLATLVENAPTLTTVRVAREDGYSRIVERRTVLLVRTGETDVTALDPTCTHLGCRVSWDDASKELRCPCHGGAYDHMGIVKSGPPPEPLPRLATRIEGNRIFIQA